MQIIMLIISYILVSFMVSYVPSIPLALSLWFLFPLLKKIKFLLPILIFILNTILRVVGVFVAVWLCGKLKIEPILLMIIIPAIAIILNDGKRVFYAKRGISNVRHMLERSGELKEYNKTLDIITEYSYYASDVVGLLLGVLYFLNDASFF